MTVSQTAPEASIPQSQNLANTLIAGALAPVHSDLQILSEKLGSYLPSESESAARVIDYIMSAGGKRVRPALYFMTCQMLGYRGDHYYPIGAVGEFVHTASLLHDDVVDNSTLRRGKPTSNSIWGDETSVLVGDLIYSTASEMMAETGNIEIVKTFAGAIRMMSDGELLQLENLYKPTIEESTYLKILECKTAILIGAVCRSAALLANAPAEVVQDLTIFGRGIGMAFQLIDDALDYTSGAEELGKDTLADLLEGKVTMPVILARRAASAAEKVLIDEICLNEQITKSDVEKVAKLVDKYDTAGETVERARVHTERSMEILMKFPASEARTNLENLANKLLFRYA